MVVQPSKSESIPVMTQTRVLWLPLLLVVILWLPTSAIAESCEAAEGTSSYFGSGELTVCDASLICLTTFCDCVNGTNVSMCIHSDTSNVTLEQCMTARVHCTIAAALSSTDSAEDACKQWATSLANLYHAQSSTNASNLTTMCVDDLCSDVPASLKPSVDLSKSCSDFSPVGPNTTTAVATTTMAATTTDLPSTTTGAPTTAAPNTTTPAPTSVATPIPVTPVATAVRVTFSGTQWGTVLRNNRSVLQEVVQNTIASTLNVSASDVNVTSMSVGSLVVLFQLLSGLNTASANAAIAQTLATSLNVADLNTFYQSAANTSESTSVSSTGVVASNGVVLGSPSSCGDGCIAGVVVGVILGVALAVGIIFVVRAKCMSSPKRSTASAEDYTDNANDAGLRCPTSAAAQGQFSRMS